MIRCLDIHTHHPAPRPLAVVNTTPDGFNPLEGQFYSIGIHPWLTTDNPSEEEWKLFEKLAMHPAVVAIGECGIDKFKGGPLYRQMLVLKRHIEISEKVSKPLILHDVKAHDIIVGLRKDMNPTQNWVVHGLRTKPSVARMLTDSGIYVSFGEKFNPDTPRVVPREMILAETDESSLPIEEIIAALSQNMGENILEIIARNTYVFLNLNCKSE